MCIASDAYANLRGNPLASPGAAGGQAAQAAAKQQAADQVQRAASVLARTTQTLQAMQALQESARQAAQQAASSVVDGLDNGNGGGLKPSDTTPWLGAELKNPTGTTTPDGVDHVDILQTDSKAILTWDRFDVGLNTIVDFDQKTNGKTDAANWIALNRISGSTTPSQILGKIKADGQVYIINPNGIIFGGASQVNVHTLVASSLDFFGATITDKNATFLQGIANDSNRANYTLGSDGGTGVFAPDDGVIVNAGANLAADDGGAVYLFGHNVTNSGAISAPDGQVLLAAGQRVWISKNRLGLVAGDGTQGTDPDLRGVRASVQLGGLADNEGSITTERGNITMTAKSVKNDGVLEATTSADLNGSVTLIAGDGAALDNKLYWMFPTNFGDVTLGPKSLIDIEPDETSAPAAASEYLSSKIDIFAQTILMQQGSLIRAPGARVNLTAKTNSSTAQAGNDPSYIYLADGAEIDLSGELDVAVPMEQNTITGKLNLSQLANDPLQRDGPLHGLTVSVDLRRGTTFADFSGYYSLIQYSADQLMTSGGSLQLDSGTIVTRPGSTINLSGGSIQYQDGYVTTTRLLGADGHIYDISTASADIRYTGIFDNYSQKESGYVEGKSAGSLIIGPQLFKGANPAANPLGTGNRPYYLSLEGTIQAGTVEGPYQRLPATSAPGYQQAWQQLPQAASLTIGYIDAVGNYYGPNITIGSQLMLPADFQPGDSIDATPNSLVLPASLFDGHSFGQVALISGIGGGDLTIEPGVTVNLGVFGSFSFLGSHAEIDGSIIAPGGTVGIDAVLAKGYGENDTSEIDWTRLTSEQRPWIKLGGEASIDVSGLWVNDRLAGSSTGPLVLNGGSVSLISVSNLVLASGSAIDVSGGGQLTTASKLVSGNGGSITLDNDQLPTSDHSGFTNVPYAPSMPNSLVGVFDVMGAQLRGYALGQGGSLSLGTSRAITITNQPGPNSGTGASDLLYLTPDFFQGGGFASYAVAAAGDLTVSAHTTITPRTLSYMPGPALWSLPTGGDLGAVAAPAIPIDPNLLTPMALVLSNGLRDATGSLATLKDIANLPVTISNSAVPQGKLTIGTGAQILMAPQSKISLYSDGDLNVDGTLQTDGGSILLNVLPYQASSLRLGPNAQLLAPGFVKTTEGSRSLQSIQPGGSVILSVNNADAVQNSVYTDLNSKIDVEGVSGLADLLGTSTGGLGALTTYIRRQIGGSAGSVAIQGFRGGFIAGIIEATPGSAQATGGQITIQAGDAQTNVRTELLLTDRTTDRATGTALFPTVTPTSPTGGGVLTVYAPALRASGADSFNLYSAQSVAFDGDFTLIARRSISLGTPLVGIAPDAPADAQVELDAPYVSFPGMPGLGSNPSASPFPATPPASPPTLLGRFEVEANLIDIDYVDLGGNGLGGFGEGRFVSSGDIRLTVVATSAGRRGRLQSPGALILASAQTYVTTADALRADSDVGFLIQSGREVDFVGNGGATSVPYSFGETLTVQAPTIMQGGVVRAPQGRIKLLASDSLVLAPGSLTSVSLEGAIVPIGATNENNLLALFPTAGEVPVKAITLGGPSVNVQKGAVVDLSGGGDLSGYTFVQGNGGSTDILNAAGVYAILPGYKAPAAAVMPSTTGGLSDGTLKVGDSVYLSGVPGLADGVYTLLPAHYALLPGGFAIKPLSTGYADAVAAAMPQPDGSYVATGYRLVAGTPIMDQTETRFEVLPQSVVRSYSQYLDVSFNSYATTLANQAGVAVPRLPVDAGTLTLAATRSLTLDGTGRLGAANGLLGNVDVAAPKIALVGDGQQAPDASYLSLDATQVSDFGIGSLLLGGARSQATTGTQVSVAASSIYVANDASSELVVPELILAATGTITIADGSVIDATGTVSNNTSPLLLSGNGALLRASTGDQVNVTRTGATIASGQLLVGKNVTLAATGSLTLDGTQSVVTTPTTTLQAPQLSLSSAQVSVGEAPAGTGGLVLSSEAIDALGSARSLLLRSYGMIDFYGSVSIGGPGSGQNTLIFDAAGFRGMRTLTDTDPSKDVVTITAGEIEIRNSTGATPTTGTGAGTLSLTASTLMFGPGSSTINGFSNVTANVGQMSVTGQGSLTVSAPLNVTANLVTAAKASDYQVISTGAVAIAQGQGAAPQPTDFGGRLKIVGTDVSLDTLFDLPSGVLEAEATTGNLNLGARAQVLAQGWFTPFYDQPTATPGGTIRLTADVGNVSVAQGAKLDVSGYMASDSTQSSSDAGSIEITATQGRVSLAGSLLGNAAQAYSGGSFSLDAKIWLDDFSNTNKALNTAGFTAKRDIRLRGRDQAITLNVGDEIEAHDILLQSDAGSVTINGTLLADGTTADPDGGSVTLVSGTIGGTNSGSSPFGVNLGATARINASALDNSGAAFPAQSGHVDITAWQGKMDIAAGSVITAQGGASGGGTVTVTAQRVDTTGIATDQFAGTFNARELVVRGEKDTPFNSGTVGAADYNQMLASAADWMNNTSAKIPLSNAHINAQLDVEPGIGVYSTGDLTIAADLDLSGALYGANGTPGAITFAAAGNLLINGSVSSGFSNATTAGALLGGRSWDLTFQAGQDITLAAGKLIRTGTGDIMVEAGRDLVLKDTRSVIYTAGQKVADEAGFTAGNRVGDYPVNGGDVTIVAGRDILAPLTNDFTTGWLYRYGSASSAAGVDLSQLTVSSQSSWSVVFANFDQGIGALGGGNVDIQAGRDIHDISVALPTTAQQTTPVGAAVNSTSGSLVVRGGGDLSVYAGRDIYGGEYMVGRGEANVTADGEIGSDTKSYQRNSLTIPNVSLSNYTLKNINALFALMDASLTVRARSDVEIEAIVDPMMVQETTANRAGNGKATFFFSYTDRTAADIASSGGNIVYDDNPWAAADLTVGNTNLLMPLSTGNGANLSIPRDLLFAPGSLRLTASQGNIAFDSAYTSDSATLRLAPSPTGTLDLLAAGDIESALPIVMMDVAPQYLRTGIAPYSIVTPGNPIIATADLLGLTTNYGRGTSALHSGDDEPAHVYTLEGDIDNLQLSLPKALRLWSGNDVTDLQVFAQNNNPNDLTLIRAQEDIVDPYIAVAGPGRLVVDAARDITMETSSTNSTLGIYSLGNNEIFLGTSWWPADLGGKITIPVNYVTDTSTPNLALHNAGADVSLLAGADGADYNGFAAAYLSPTNASGVVRTYLPELRDYMAGLGYTGLDDAQLLEVFDSLAFKTTQAETRQMFLLQVFLTELKETGIDFNDPSSPRFASYKRGRTAVATLFGDGKNAPTGNINLFAKPVISMAGGSFTVLAPHGQIQIDQSAGGSTAGQTASSGIITQRGGGVQMMSNGDIALGNSRVFTLEGGDILMWTTHGNITAGNGSNTTASFPQLQFVVDNDADVLLNVTALQSGSGIGALDATLTGAIKSRVDLIAPEGTVDAGDAGIRASGNVNIAALHVLNAQNITASGTTTGVPVVAAPNVAAITAASAISSSLTSASDETAQKQREAVTQQETPSFFNVEVMGYGGGNADDDSAP